MLRLETRLVYNGHGDDLIFCLKIIYCFHISMYAYIGILFFDKCKSTEVNNISKKQVFYVEQNVLIVSLETFGVVVEKYSIMRKE